MRTCLALVLAASVAGAACMTEPAGVDGTAGRGGAGGSPAGGRGGAVGSSGGVGGGAAGGGVSGGTATGGATSTGGAPIGSGGMPPGTGGVNAGGAGGTTSGAGGGGTGGKGGGGHAGASASGGTTGNGGASPSGGAMGAGGAVGPNGIITVGYGGLRILSRDLGMTWTNESHWSTDGGDDNDLLRAIAYGNGVWMSAGWRYVTSTDGIHWTDHGMADDVVGVVACAVFESAAFGQGRFVGACGDNLVWSTDGLTWKKLGATPNIQKHPWLVFDPGTNRFAVTGDNNKSFVSSDMGATWTELKDVTGVRLCLDGLNPTSKCPSFYTDGVFLRGQWKAQVQRSTDGKSWSKSITLPASDSVFTDYAFAVGPVAPSP